MESCLQDFYNEFLSVVDARRVVEKLFSSGLIVDTDKDEVLDERSPRLANYNLYMIVKRKCYLKDLLDALSYAGSYSLAEKILRKKNSLHNDNILTNLPHDFQIPTYVPSPRNVDGTRLTNYYQNGIGNVRLHNHNILQNGQNINLIPDHYYNEEDLYTLEIDSDVSLRETMFTKNSCGNIANHSVDNNRIPSYQNQEDINDSINIPSDVRSLIMENQEIINNDNENLGVSIRQNSLQSNLLCHSMDQTDVKSFISN